VQQQQPGTGAKLTINTTILTNPGGFSMSTASDIQQTNNNNQLHPLYSFSPLGSLLLFCCCCCCCCVHAQGAVSPLRVAIRTLFRPIENSADGPTFGRVEGVTFLYFSADFWIFVYQYLADRWIVLFHLIPSFQRLALQWRRQIKGGTKASRREREGERKMPSWFSLDY